MSLTLDPTFAALQVLPYLVTTFALYFILFQPLYAYLTEREGVSASARNKADQLNADADARSSELADKLAVTRNKVAEIRAAARSRAKAREEELLSSARSDAEANVAAGVAKIEASAVEARATMKTMTQELAREIGAQVLGRGLEN